MQTFQTALSQWLTVHSIGRRPRTVEFNTEIIGTILKHWRDVNQTVDSITLDDVLTFAPLVSRYSGSRWNAIVSALRFITPHAKTLPRRAVTIRSFSPPGQTQFAALLAECDSARRSKVGLVVRFLAFTGLRISEARALTWQNVGAESIEVPANVSKNRRKRPVPLLAGVSDVLSRLRALKTPGDYILPRQNARKAIESACRRAGIPHMSHHCFRHLFATRCIEQGVDLPTVARWLGHRDGGALLARTYFHLVDEHSRAMAARVKMDSLPCPITVKDFAADVHSVANLEELCGLFSREGYAICAANIGAQLPRRQIG